ncbi:MAG: AsmA-like C-terminal region-containing protein [bacterium]
MNKYLKISLITVASLFLGLFILVQTLPLFVNGDQFKGTICKEFEKATELKLSINKIKLSGAPVFKTKITLEKPLVTNKKGENIFYSDKISASINLLPILFKEIQISDVEMISPDIYLTKEEDGKFEFETEAKPTAQQEFEVVLDGMNFIAEDYRLQYIDKTAPKLITAKAKGKKLELLGFNNNSGTKFNTDGVMAINNVRCLNYDIKTKIDLPAFIEYQKDHPEPKTARKIKVNPLYEMYKNGLKADLKADLKIKTPEDINGEVLIDKLSMKINSKKLPDSRMHIKAKKDKFFTIAKLYISPKGILDVDGEFKKDFIDLKLKTSHMQLAELQSFVNPILSSIGTPIQEIEKLNLQGEILADLRLKSNLKNIKSDGFLKIKNAKINYCKGLLVINSFNSDIKLNNNNISILNTGGIIDGNKFTVKGNVDPNANTNIQINIPSLSLKSATKSKEAQAQLAGISNLEGKISAIVDLKGKLDKLKYQGVVTLNGMNIILKDSPAKISFPIGKINLNSEKALLSIPLLYVNKSAFNLNGTIPFNEEKINLSAKGRLKSSDLATILNSGPIGQGEVPAICNILIDKDALNITLQLLNDANNNILIQGVGSNSILSAILDIKGAKTNLSNVGLYKTSKTALSNNPTTNLQGSSKIATADGAVKTSGKQVILDNIKVKVLSPIRVSLPIGKGSTSNMTGETTLNGNAKNPSIKGDFVLSNAIIPDLKGKVSKATVSFKNQKIVANISGLSAGKTNLNAQTTIDIRSFDPAVIEVLDINAGNFNADEFFGLLGKLFPAPKTAQKVEYSLNKKNTMHLSPVTIKSGNFYAKTFVINAVPCHELHANINLDRYNIFKASNLTTEAMQGSVTGEVLYDLVSAITSLNIKARGIDVGTFGQKFLGTPQGQLSGLGDANAKLSFKGATTDEITRSLQGAANIHVENGEMGDLGRIDYYLRAANILSNNILSLNLNRILNGVRLKRTGEFDRAYGRMTFIKGGILRIDSFKTEGPRLSILLKGYINNLNMYGSINVYGRLSEEVVGILGPLGDFSVEKILQKVPAFNSLTRCTIGLIETNVSDSQRKEIPPLSIQGANSQEFTAKIDGNITKPSAVKSFRWIRTYSPQEQLPQACPVQN